MENMEWAANAVMETESGQHWVLNYYVHNPGAKRYGLHVEKRTEAGLLAEAETTPVLTASRTQAVTLAKKLARGSVPPCVLIEIMDEIAL
jgi:hypothetical protein